ncbi:MAG: ribosome recycling factor [Clostridia bacterium]|nr:MAG: ribosome recycling factor [Clostridia bacterium]
MSDIYKVAEEKMNKSVNAMLNEYAAIRAGRANPAVLDRVEVEYYGAPTPLNQMAAISVPDARTLVVQPWDKSSLKDIERGILTADIGINPQNDGSVIRLVFPPLTEERRREIGKNIFKLAEDCKIAIRSIRRDAMDKLKDQKKKAEITEDDLKDEEKKMQDLTDKFCKEIDGLAAKKDKEIMEV